MPKHFDMKQLLGTDTRRLGCPKCANVLLIVDYEPLHKKGKKKVGLYGKCCICGFSTRIHAGQIK